MSHFISPSPRNCLKHCPLWDLSKFLLGSSSSCQWLPWFLSLTCCKGVCQITFICITRYSFWRCKEYFPNKVWQFHACNFPIAGGKSAIAFLEAEKQTFWLHFALHLATGHFCFSCLLQVRFSFCLSSIQTVPFLDQHCLQVLWRKTMRNQWKLTKIC